MFKKLFDIGNTKKTNTKTVVYKPAIVEVKKPQPVKPDALKRLEKILDQVEHLNNPKADTLRKLFVHLQSDSENATDLIAFLKQPIKKTKKRATVKLNKI